MFGRMDPFREDQQDDASRKGLKEASPGILPLINSMDDEN
jgi:hypothetical protein